MEAISLCPTCYQPLTTVGLFQICPVHGQVSLEPQPHAPLRIFLSYGHDHNEELVRMIKTDLEKRGHDVWFDKNEIKFGDDWRRSITENIINSNRVLSFLSKYSTRDPGVCRDEIAIAIGVKGGNIQTILIESELEVQPPVNIGHIQWLDMHDWQEKKAINEADWKQWYQAKLAEIVKVVESDETFRFAGEIEKLNEYLKPIKSDARISGLLSKGFYGREWLFDAVENWRKDTKNDSRLFWIMGDPGVGKSAFAAQLTHKHGDTVIAAQFCDWTMTDHRDARRVVCSIAFQISTRLPDYRKLLLTLPEIKELDRKDASELFDYLLANPLKSVINGGRENLLILIDALDEAGESGRNPLVEMLARNAQHLPDWLGIVVTSRPEFDVKTPFQALNPFPLDTKSESNRADIRDYLLSKLASQLQNRPDAEKLVAQILEKSEGVFLYVERFCDDIEQKHISLDNPDQFPQGLGGIFAQYFQRQFPDLEKFHKEIRPALRAILAAREPLPIGILQKLFNWQDEELRDFTFKLSSLFPVRFEVVVDKIKPYHKSLADWLTDEERAGIYYVSVTEGHKLLAEYGWREYQTGVGNLSSYILAQLSYHLVQMHEWGKMKKLLMDLEFLEAKLQSGFTVQLIADYDSARNHWKSSGKYQKKVKKLFHDGDRNNQLRQRIMHINHDNNQKLDRLLDFHGLIDWLAIEYQRKANSTAFISLYLYLIIGITLLFYKNFSQSILWLLFGLFLLRIGLFMFFQISKKFRSHHKWIELRYQAETLKILFFWRLAGISDSQINNFCSERNDHNNWLQKSIHSARVVNATILSNPDSNSKDNSNSQPTFIDICIRGWIKNELGYISEVKEIRFRRERNIKLLVKVIYSISAITILIAFITNALTSQYFWGTEILGFIFLSCATAEEFNFKRMRRANNTNNLWASKLEEIFSSSYDKLRLLSEIDSKNSASEIIFELGKKVIENMDEFLPKLPQNQNNK